MAKIVFPGHCNICRRPMAGFIMKDLVKKAELESEFHIESSATSPEELGNPVYPPSRPAAGYDSVRRACGRASEVSGDSGEAVIRLSLNITSEQHRLPVIRQTVLFFPKEDILTAERKKRSGPPP